MTLAIQTSRLQQLATEVNSRHTAIESSLHRALKNAFEAGELLNEAQRLVPHGGWAQWLSENFSGSQRTAQRYMCLAENRPQIEAHGGIENRGIQEALQLLAQPEMSDQPLTDDERQRLAELEEKIELGFSDPAYWRCCACLIDIRARRLWRVSAPSFEAWVAQHMEIDIQRAGQFVEIMDQIFAAFNLKDDLARLAEMIYQEAA